MTTLPADRPVLARIVRCSDFLLDALGKWPVPETEDPVQQLQALPSMYVLMARVPRDLVVLVPEAVALLTHEKLVTTILSAKGVDNPVHSLLMLTKSGRALVQRRASSNGEARP